MNTSTAEKKQDQDDQKRGKTNGKKNDKKINKQPHFVCCVCVRVFKTRKILFPILQYLFECSSLISRKYSISFILFVCLGSFSIAGLWTQKNECNATQCNAMRCKVQQTKAKPSQMSPKEKYFY